MDGGCTEDDDDICQGYFCFNDKVVNGEGRECYIENNGVNSNCSISGTFCDVESNTCRRPYEAPRVIRNYMNAEECEFDYGCDEGLYCKPYRGRDGEKCSPCLVDEVFPEKGAANFPMYIYGEYNYPHICAIKDQECDDASENIEDRCCYGLKCYGGPSIIEDYCKKTGTCDNDGDGCDGYGYLNGKVVFAGGQECYSENGQASANCTDGTVCHDFENVCYRRINEEVRTILRYEMLKNVSLIMIVMRVFIVPHITTEMEENVFHALRTKSAQKK